MKEKIRKQIKTLQAKLNLIEDREFKNESLPKLRSKVGKYYMFDSDSEFVKFLQFDEDKGYKVEKYTLQKEKGIPIHFSHEVNWQSWYPFYDIKTASPIGHGYTECTQEAYEDFIERALEGRHEI